MSLTVVGYGELMLRLTPQEHGSLLEQSESLKFGFAGAEANILGDLSLLGHKVGFVSTFPKNSIGRSALKYLGQLGIDESLVTWDDGRIGTYYIEHGSSIRGTRVTYDRANSSVTNTKITAQAWQNILRGAKYFVLTGITPALSQVCRDNIKEALSVANMSGIKVVVDLNYRRTLWDQFSAKQSFLSILPFVDVLIGNVGSVRDIFGIGVHKFSGYDSLIKATEIAVKGLEEISYFDCVALTMRLQKSATENELGGVIKRGDQYFYSASIKTEIVDRLGGGDAFTAGIIHGLINDWPEDKIIKFASASFALTQTLKGDINYMTEAEILAVANGAVKGYVKR